MSDKNPVLSIAYCLETDRFEAARTAHLHQKDTFYCPKCHILVTPARSCKHNYFFRALKILHDTNCRYHKEPTEATGTSTPKAGDPIDQPLLIPNFLGKIKRIPRIGRPDPAELAALIARAQKLPVLVQGTLEAVADAWSSLSFAERRKEFLTINDVNRSYSENFNSIDNNDYNLDTFDWDGKIIHGDGKLTKGSAKGYYFVNCYRKFVINGEIFPLNITLGPEFTETYKKYSLCDLIHGKVKIFLHGCRPVFNPERRCLTVTLPKDLYQFVFAMTHEPSRAIRGT
ncbi:hypothetical protein [Acetobacter persici]|uniref:hypothetical protein n=1 Tax=Acetobacter persici TaxID=1076596 RepID=UPI001BA85D81|nr:hypothetical protein [Acetobacter persici]MBS0961903.1 hypothetical protein [Acetobacter persici]